MFACCALLLSARALGASSAAHTNLKKAAGAYRAKKYNEALKLLDKTEKAGGLSRALLLDLLEWRALTHLARGDGGSSLANAALLYSIAPAHQLSSDEAQQHRETFERAKQFADGPPDYIAKAKQKDCIAYIRTRVVRAKGAVRHVEIALNAGKGVMRYKNATRLSLRPLKAKGLKRLRYTTQAIGPGGAPLTKKKESSLVLTSCR